jgi:hypothetical protein
MTQVKAERTTTRDKRHARIAKQEEFEDSEDLNECRSEPVTNNALLALIGKLKLLRRFRFAPAQRAETITSAEAAYLNRIANNMTPTDLYKLFFKELPDPRVERKVRNELALERKGIMSGERQRAREERSGYIYVFRDVGDPLNVLKIGRTIRPPEQRIAEWEHELSPEGGKNVILLFAYATVATTFAERIIHQTLFCEWLPKRLNARTSNALIEFFKIDNFLALKLFVRETIKYIDRLSLFYRQTVNSL